MERAIETIAIGLDGTCLLQCEQGWREAIVGTIALYDAQGERQHTLYIGATPEYGKGRFLERLEREVQRTKGRYPQATYIGIADRAETDWRVLEPHTSVPILDFYHATGYLGAVATAASVSDMIGVPNRLYRCPVYRWTPGGGDPQSGIL